MKISYDFHIHSALSPCANDDMTPTNIVAMAAVKGLGAIAIADHNSIKNVEAAIELGNAFEVVVIPAIEVQTEEEIHVLALFKSFEELSNFYNQLDIPFIQNDERIFGNQLIIDSDDNITGKEDALLSISCNIGLYELCDLILSNNGLAIPAHIDRESNGILAILGELPPDINFSAIEFSPHAKKELREKYLSYKQLTNSDAHCLDNILDIDNTLEANELSINAIFNALKA